MILPPVGDRSLGALSCPGGEGGNGCDEDGSLMGARGELPGPRELSKKLLAGHTGFSKVVMQGKTGHRVGGDICNTYC